MSTIEVTRNNSVLNSTWQTEPIKISARKWINNIPQKRIGLLPAVTRWISDDSKTFVVERAPCRQTIPYIQKSRDNALGVSKRTLYNIALPWQVYIIVIGQRGYYGIQPKVWMFVHNQPLKDLTDLVGLYPLPNIRTDGSGCLPYNAQFDTEVSPGRQVMDGINSFWSSGFNENVPRWSHTLYPENQLEPSSGTEMMQWLESASISDVLNWKWRNMRSLQKRIDVIRSTNTTSEQPTIQIVQAAKKAAITNA